MAFTDIDNPELFFQCKIHQGNAGTNAITFDGDEDMQPDLIWGKDTSGDRHWWADSVRGKKNTGYRLLASNNNQGDGSNAPPDGITAIGTDGFTLGANTSNTDGGWSFEINEDKDNGQGNSGRYITWNWKAGTSFTNDASSTGIGTIDSSGTFNNTCGISIVSWTGTGSAGTIKHGMNTVPSVIIIKNRDGGHWRMYHHKNTSAPETDYLDFSNSNGDADDNTAFNDTAPTSSVFSVGSMDETNKNTEGMIAYCFAEKQGYFKAGSYTGNGNADGAFVYTGGRPAWVITKANGNDTHWNIKDNKRSPFNPIDDYHKGNESTAEDTGVSSHAMDFLGNGFKHRGDNSEVNGSGRTYIYMAFSESPFVNSKGVPNNAR